MFWKRNVKTHQLLDWEKYSQQAAKSPEDAANLIYTHASATIRQIKDWYWKSIGVKKRTCQVVRLLMLGLLFAGTVLPVVIEGSASAEERVRQLQFGVAALACAGLLQVADKVFGWSSGWVRYMTTVTGLEALATRFEMDVAGYRLARQAGIDANDVALLFGLAKKSVDDALALQADETEKWVAEFANGTAALADALKAGKDAADKSRTDSRLLATAAAQTGTLQVTITRASATDEVAVSLDGEPAVPVVGQTWARSNVPLGVRLVHVQNLTTRTKSAIKALIVQPNAITSDTIAV